MNDFVPERETCPICGSVGSCHIHGYYGRTLIDYHAGSVSTSNVCILRVMCESCHHAHAILPDVIVPYSVYSLLFLLHVLAAYLCETSTIDQICDKFNISRPQLYKWVALWKRHKSEWLGILDELETSDLSFLEHLRSVSSYSSFAQEFTRRFAYSFLQSHKNPIPIRSGTPTAGYCQQVFAPDYPIR